MSILKTPGEQYPVNYFTTYVIGETVKMIQPPFAGLVGVIVEIRDGDDTHDPDKNPEVIVKLNPPIFDEEEENITSYFNCIYPSEAPWNVKDIGWDRISVPIYDIASMSGKVFEEYKIYAVKETIEGQKIDLLYFADEESARVEVNQRVLNAGGRNLLIYRDPKYMNVIVNDHEISMTQEIIKLSRDVERMIGWNHMDKVYMEDFMDRFDFNDISSIYEIDGQQIPEVMKEMEEDRDNIVKNINASLGNNEAYWDEYFASMDEVAKEWMESYLGRPTLPNKSETAK